MFEHFKEIPIPEIIYLTHTSGREEGDGAYTRGKSGIFIPTSFLDMPQIDGVIVHEIWHLISRKISPELKNKVYACIGFKPMGHVMEYPSELVKISNPDATKIEHYIEITLPNNTTLCLTPIIYSSSANFNPFLGQTFFPLHAKKANCSSQSW